MPLLGTYLAGTVPFAGEHLVDAKLETGGQANVQASPGVAVGGVLQAAGGSEFSQFAALRSCGRLAGEGVSGGAFVGGVRVECPAFGCEGSSFVALAPSLHVCGQIAALGSSCAVASGYARYQGVGIRVDFRPGGDLPQIIFQ